MHYLAALAKSAVETFIVSDNVINVPANLPLEFKNKKSGVAVLIEKITGNECGLLGCGVTYLPLYKNIAEEAIYNAVFAATKAPGFNRATKKDFDCLRYTVYAINTPELTPEIKDLDIKKYGIIVRTRHLSHNISELVCGSDRLQKSGLVLPGFKEADTVDKQIAIACEKGGIEQKRENILIYRFTVEKYI